MILFADDTTIYSSGSIPEEAKENNAEIFKEELVQTK